MPYLNLDLDYFDHIKTKRLVGLLGRNAEVLPIKLWSACGKHHAENGRLTGYSTHEIESICTWWGQEGQMVEAMVKVGFLDPIEGGYQIHDWFEHAGHLAAFKKRAKSGAKARWAKYASSNATSNREKKLSNAPHRGRLGRSVKVGSEEGESKGGDWPSPRALIALYNEKAPDECPAVEQISPGRIDKAKKYLAMFPKKEFWEEVFSEIHQSPFLRGLSNSPGHENWVCKLDWLLSKNKDGTENCVKVAEAQYRKR